MSASRPYNSPTTREESRERPLPSLNAAQPWRSKNPLTSFRHAAEGVIHTFRTQRNMRFHFFTAILVLLSGLLLRFGKMEMLALLFAISLVLMAEMFNTAVEVVVDMITQNYHPAAKFAKDIAAGAALIASINAVVVGMILFLWDGRPEMLRLRLQSPSALYIFITGFLLLLILLVVLKVMGEKGTLLRGGVVSGHSAIAFFLATTIMFVTGNIFATACALLLALLVAQARVEARFHTVQEVVIGAALALFLTACAYQLPNLIGKLIPASASAPTVISPGFGQATAVPASR
jgi:diacylglycerol kinase (ATP)